MLLHYSEALVTMAVVSASVMANLPKRDEIPSCAGRIILEKVKVSESDSDSETKLT